MGMVCYAVFRDASFTFHSFLSSLNKFRSRYAAGQGLS